MILVDVPDASGENRNTKFADYFAYIIPRSVESILLVLLQSILERYPTEVEHQIKKIFFTGHGSRTVSISEQLQDARYRLRTCRLRIYAFKPEISSVYNGFILFILIIFL